MQFHENFEPQKFGAIYTVHVHVNHQKKKKNSPNVLNLLHTRVPFTLGL